MLRLVFTLAFLFRSVGLAPEISAQGLVDPDVWEAFHKKDIRAWAHKSGLSVATVESLLRATAGDGGADNVYSIQNIDTKSLRKRGHILIALTGPATGHALSVYVVRARLPYALIWNAFGLDENGSCPAETFATESILGEATASVSPRGRILVKMPIWNGQPDVGGEHKSVLLVASYSWTGKSYVLVEERQFTHYRWDGRDYVGSGAGVVKKCN